MAHGPVKNPLKFDAERQAIFLLALTRSGEITMAAAAAKVSTSTVYDKINSDPDFAHLVEDAKRNLLERAMETLKLVALDGVEEPVLDKHGMPIMDPRYPGQKRLLVKRKYDTKVLLRFIERHLKDYRKAMSIEQSGKVEHVVKDARPVKPSDLSADARASARDFLDKIRQEKNSN